MNFAFITTVSAEEPGKIIGFGMDLPWDLLLQWIALFIVIGILYKLLFRPVGDFLERRKEGIAKTIEEAKEQRTSALQLKAGYETKLESIKEEADQILKSTRKKALQKEEAMIKAAKEEAEYIRQKAFDEIQLEQERAKEDIKKEIIELSMLMAGKLINTSLDKEKHEELIEQIIRELGAVQWQI